MRRIDSLTLSECNVTLVGISPDTPQEAAWHRARDALSCEMLCDPDRVVIRQFGLFHRRGLVHKTVYVFGIPIGLPTGFRELVIPTSILVDEHGIVRWIDQSDDYRMRSGTDVLVDALEAVFGPV